ncbi:hypothetical protein ABMA32_19205 [Mesorhizobium sp. VNQ89]|uniref:hypothetical protein n=1 Tax=Mesorhizobium quangtriensis TaxID=3157709 RepID=UPI0032B72D35
MKPETIAQLVAIALVVPMIALEVHLIREALANGVLPSRGRSYDRNREPGAFWFAVAFHAVCIAGLTAIGGYSAYRLISG